MKYTHSSYTNTKHTQAEKKHTGTHSRKQPFAPPLHSARLTCCQGLGLGGGALAFWIHLLRQLHVYFAAVHSLLPPLCKEKRET